MRYLPRHETTDRELNTEPGAVATAFNGTQKLDSESRSCNFQLGLNLEALRLMSAVATAPGTAIKLGGATLLSRPPTLGWVFLPF